MLIAKCLFLLSELSDVVEMMLLKKMYVMLRSKILKIQYLILLLISDIELSY